jgi:hypothetical protein
MYKVKITLAKNLNWSSKYNNGNLKITNVKMTMGHLMFKIRMMLGAIDASEALFLFIDNLVLVSNSDLLIHIHNKYQKNNILNITVVKEATFGN